MTWISIGGIAIGVSALIIVLSVMGGFEDDLLGKMLRGQPHIEIMAKDASLGFPLKENPIESFKKVFPEAIAFEPFTQSDVVLKQRKHLSSATLIGVDPSSTNKLWGFHGALTEGKLSDLLVKHTPVYWSQAGEPPLLPGIILGDGLATQLGAELGDEINILTPYASISDVLGGISVSSHFVLVGKFRSDLFNFDGRWAVVALSDGRRFLPEYADFIDKDEYVSGVAFNVKDPLNIENYTGRMGSLPGLQAQTWQTVNKSLLFALKLEKFAMGSILMLIVVVAGFSISGTLMMTVYHRRNQVALLQAIGMGRKDIALLFLSHGMAIAFVGIVLGTIFGLVVCALIKFFRFIPLPEGVYYLKALPVKFLPFDYGVICLLALLLALAAAIYPAITASRQEPSKGLRYE